MDSVVGNVFGGWVKASPGGDPFFSAKKHDFAGFLYPKIVILPVGATIIGCVDSGKEATLIWFCQINCKSPLQFRRMVNAFSPPQKKITREGAFWRCSPPPFPPQNDLRLDAIFCLKKEEERNCNKVVAKLACGV